MTSEFDPEWFADCITNLLVNVGTAPGLPGDIDPEYSRLMDQVEAAVGTPISVSDTPRAAVAFAVRVALRRFSAQQWAMPIERFGETGAKRRQRDAFNYARAFRAGGIVIPASGVEYIEPGRGPKARRETVWIGGAYGEVLRHDYTESQFRALYHGEFAPLAPVPNHAVDPCESSGYAAAFRREFAPATAPWWETAACDEPDPAVPWSGIEFAHDPFWWYGQPLAMVRHWPDGYTASVPDGVTVLPLTDEEMEPIG